MRTTLLRAILLLVFATSLNRIRADEPAAAEAGGKSRVPWNEAEIVFTADLESATAGPVALSEPPIHNHTLKLVVKRVLRGDLKPKETVTGHHAAMQEKAPEFPVGKQVIVAAKRSQGTLSIQRIEEADDTKIAEVEKLCALPLGWRIVNDKIASPWASLGKAAWPAGEMANAPVKCSETGRPALLLGPNFKFAVEAVPAKADPTIEHQHPEWVDPDGDGLYKITLTNTSDRALPAPALLSDGRNILWDESLVILCQGKAYPCPGCKGVSGKVEAVTLKPGESVSTVVNALRLKGPEWPRGGYRIEFQFCLGEKSQTKSFYYYSNHHDKIRDAAQAAKE